MVQWELDSFYAKFKNLLRTEKDATLTLKAEAGRAFVTLSVDLGHVLSDQDQLHPPGPRNGPSRQRRREKRQAARQEKLSAENVESVEEITVEVTEDNASHENPATTAEEATAEKAAAEKATAEKATAEKATAEKATEPDDLNTNATEKVEENVKDLMDEVCPDDVYTYNIQSNQLISVATQTLECGVKPINSSKSTFDYTFRYDKEY